MAPLETTHTPSLAENTVIASGAVIEIIGAFATLHGESTANFGSLAGGIGAMVLGGVLVYCGSEMQTRRTEH